MASRLHARIPISLTGQLISYNVSYDVIIENISEYGIYARLPLNERETEYQLDSDIMVNLHLPYSESVNLNCKKRWSYQTRPDSLIENIGIEVINPPEKYREFYWAALILLNSVEIP